MIRPLFLGLLLLGSSSVGAQMRRLPPVDRCAADPSFAAFRTQLLAAVRSRDAAFVLAAASDDITFSFGDEPGRAGFARAWGLDQPATSRLWRELGAALRLGCAREPDGALRAPSMSLLGDEEDEGYRSRVVVVGPGAALRAVPSDRGRSIAALRWDVLTLPPDDDGQSVWIRVTMADARRGYVRRSQVRGFGDFRAIFEKRDGRWRMTAFVAGD